MTARVPSSSSRSPRGGAVTLWLRQDAPALPLPGAPCNGCGACCALEPCPLGMLASRRRQGRCRLLRWNAASGAYRCGALARADGLRWRWLRPWARSVVARWIGAGLGCDAALEQA